MFQSYALFPNLTVAQNIAFGLENQGLARDLIKERVDHWLGLVDLTAQSHKYPSQNLRRPAAAGGAGPGLGPLPGLLLLDEPLSALDALVRTHLRSEIRALQQRLGITTIMVTHDQEEALTMADRIVVMEGGRIVQVGTPQEMYHQPASRFVASFVGTMNFLETLVLSPIRCASTNNRCNSPIRPQLAANCRWRSAPGNHPECAERAVSWATWR